MKEDSKEETRKAPVCAGSTGPKGEHSHRSVFPNAWARIPGERPLFEQGERNWGSNRGKKGLFAKMDFLMPGRGFMARDHFLSREGYN